MVACLKKIDRILCFCPIVIVVPLYLLNRRGGGEACEHYQVQGQCVVMNPIDDQQVGEHVETAAECVLLSVNTF